MNPDYLFESLPHRFTDKDTCEFKSAERKEHPFGHDLSPRPYLSPEEVARIIWAQWSQIRMLVNSNNIQPEMPTTSKISPPV